MIDEEKLKSARKFYPALDWIMNKPSDEEFESLANSIDRNMVTGDKAFAKVLLGILHITVEDLQKVYNESARSYYWAELKRKDK